jgi:hypothetical protein
VPRVVTDFGHPLLYIKVRRLQCKAAVRFSKALNSYGCIHVVIAFRITNSFSICVILAITNTGQGIPPSNPTKKAEQLHTVLHLSIDRLQV